MIETHLLPNGVTVRLPDPVDFPTNLVHVVAVVGWEAGLAEGRSDVALKVTTQIFRRRRTSSGYQYWTPSLGGYSSNG